MPSRRKDPLRLAHPIEALERRSEQQQRGIVELLTIVDFFPPLACFLRQTARRFR